MNRLEGKVVIITGASGGLGKQMALRFAQEGAKLAICARREKKLQETKDLCQQAGAQVLAMVADVSHHDELKAFVENHRSWILEKTEVMAEREEKRKSTPAPPPELLSKTDRMKIQLKIGKRVRHYCEIMGVTVGYVTVKNQKTRWGSCSAKGNVNFNYQLAFLPDELLDYVVIHELAHRRHMNHSRAFWAEVEKYCPDYLERREQLKEYSL